MANELVSPTLGVELHLLGTNTSMGCHTHEELSVASNTCTRCLISYNI